jgi:hypothetical protein
MTKQPERILVKQTKRYWGDFEGPLESIISSLQSELDEGWEGIEEGWESAYSTNKEYYLYSHRLETDLEYANRMKELEKKKAQAKKQRRKEYEKLKEEFGNT